MTDLATELLAHLSRRFPAADVRTRSQAGQTLHYIDIAETIKRFNDVLGLGYSFTVESERVFPLEGETNKKGNQLYAAIVRGTLLVEANDAKSVTGFASARRSGVGAHKSDDVDMAIKSAQAEAFKKAGHQFGVGLYLWDARERALVDVVNDALRSADTLSGLKFAVQQLAVIEGVSELNAGNIASHFGVSAGNLQEEPVLREILEVGGLL